MLGAATIAGVIAITAARAEHVPAAAPLAAQHGPRLVIPIMNPMRGKNLFVAKGCIACHAVNGIGGHDAPNMDAHIKNGLMNPFDFAAKM
jgi:cytochrome c